MVDAYTLFRVNQWGFLLLRKGYPEGSSLAHGSGMPRKLISKENCRCLCRVTHGPQWSVTVTYSRAGRGRQGMAPLPPLSVLRSLGFELTRAYHSRACLIARSQVPYVREVSFVYLCTLNTDNAQAPERCPRVNDCVDSLFYSERLGTYLALFLPCALAHDNSREQVTPQPEEQKEQQTTDTQKSTQSVHQENLAGKTCVSITILSLRLLAFGYTERMTQRREISPVLDRQLQFTLFLSKLHADDDIA